MTRIIPEKESVSVEFKSDLSCLPDSDIIETIVALSNSAGGDLYLGVEDNGVITGVHKDHKDITRLYAFIANNTVPPVSARVELVNDAEPVIKISIPKSVNGIIATASGKVLRRRLKADGTPESVPMFPAEQASRLSDLRMVDYSALMLTEASLDDFDPVEIQRLRNNIQAYDGEKNLLELSDIDLFQALGFCRDFENHSIPTLTGLLILGRVNSIKKYVPTHSISFQALIGTEVRVNDSFELPILAAIEKLNTYLDAWNANHEIELGMFRMSAPDFDKRAVREALINAFSHRDYTRLGRIRVAIDDSGLTIANPGGFIEGVNLKNLLTVEPHGRNPGLADALKRIGLAERTGRGIDRIFEGSLIYGRFLPDYSNSTDTTVSLLLPRCKPDAQIARMIANEQNRLGRPLSINTLLILNTLKDSPRSTAQQIAEYSNLSETLVRVELEQAISSGLAEAIGTGRGRTYILSHSVYQSKGQRAGYVRQKDIDKARYEELVIELAKNNQYISRADVVALLHINEPQAYMVLKKLADRGILTPVNKGRYAKYRYSKK